MSMYLALDGEVSTELASNTGWKNLRDWMDTLDSGDFEEVVHFAEHGWCQNVAEFSNQLATAVKENKPKAVGVADSVSEILSTLRHAGAEVISLSDGMTEEPSETKSYWTGFTKQHQNLTIKDQPSVPAKFNDAKMMAEAIISTPIVDRDGEVMIPKGCDLSAYQQYAPWFLDHQGGPEMRFPFPIGSAKERAHEKDCPPDIFPEMDRVWGRCWFNQETPEAEVTYRLWRIGHMGATSVGFEGKKFRILSGRDAAEFKAERVKVYDLWQLCEVSIVGIGCNREAMAMHASRGHIEKLKIPESMKSWMSQWLVAPKLFRTNPLTDGSAASNNGLSFVGASAFTKVRNNG